MRYLILIAILIALLVGSCLGHRIDVLRADTDARLIEIQETASVASAIAQDLQAAFARNEALILDAIEAKGDCHDKEK